MVCAEGRRLKPQVPPLRYATVGMTDLLNELKRQDTKAFSVRVLTVGERVVLSHPLCKRRTKDGAPSDAALRH